MDQSHSPVVAPRFASVGGYDSLLAPPIRQPRLAPPVDHRRCSSVTCSSTGSSYLERRGSAMVMPCLPPPPSYPRHAAYDEPWDLYYPIDIQVYSIYLQFYVFRNLFLFNNLFNIVDIENLMV